MDDLARKFPKVALVHYWLVGMRGGERVLESLCRLFPQADIFTHVYDPKRVSPLIRHHTVFETKIAKLPWARRLYPKYLPLMPRALEALDLAGYDLVISSEAGPAKGVIVPPGVPHVCYCHSPMRYVWDQYHSYRNQAGLLTRLGMSMAAHRLRQWDVTSSARVDLFLANSNHVADRIRKYWRREAVVLPPPVALDAFANAATVRQGDYYLWAGELAPYKRPDIAVRAFQKLDKPLLVIGGPQREIRALKSMAGPKTKFLGPVSFSQLKSHMAACKALIFPGEEDFGIVPVEAMAAGRPVIAYGRGGVLDTVIDGQTGLFFDQQTPEGLAAAVQRFEQNGLGPDTPQACQTRSRQFGEDRFHTGMRAALSRMESQILRQAS